MSTKTLTLTIKVLQSWNTLSDTSQHSHTNPIRQGITHLPLWAIEDHYTTHHILINGNAYYFIEGGCGVDSYLALLKQKVASQYPGFKEYEIISHVDFDWNDFQTSIKDVKEQVTYLWNRRFKDLDK